MISRALSALGLMRVSEHERIVIERDHWFKEAAKYRDQFLDLSVEHQDCAGKITGLSLRASAAEIAREAFVKENMALTASLAQRTNEIASLRPDALKWRNYLKRSRDRKAARKGSVS